VHGTNLIAASPCNYLAHVTCSMLQVDILQHLGPSLNVAYCYGAYEEQGCVGVVMELLTGGELFSRIRAGQYSEKGARQVFILLALPVLQHQKQ
jgi:hypothetical protein